MAEAVEAPSAMDGSAVGRPSEKLFSFLSPFGRAAVAIDLMIHEIVVMNVRCFVRFPNRIE